MVLALPALALSCALSAAPAGPKLAAPDWNVANVERSLASFYQDTLARGLRQRGVQVVTSAEIATLLGFERQKQLLNCAADGSTCLAELSSALGCDGTLMVSLAKLDSTLTANLKVLSAKDGHTVVETSVEADSQKGFQAKLDDAAAALAEGLMPKALGRPPSPKVPAIVGAVLVVAGAVGVGLAYSTQSALDARLAADGRVTPAAVSLAQQGKTSQTAGWVAAGAGVVALGVAGLFALMGGGAPVQPTAVLGPDSAQLGVAGTFP